MAFTISHALPTVACVRSIRAIEAAAQEKEVIGPLLWPQTATTETASNEPSDDDRSLEEEEFTRDIGFLADPSNHYLLVTDEVATKEVAYVWWQHAQGRTDAEWAEVYANRYRPPEMNKELMDATSGARFLKRAKILKDSEAFVLKELYVRPEYQRQGLGGRLVEWGVKKADELGILAYTEASAKGLGLYLRYGFYEMDRVTVDLGDWGGEKGQLHSYGLLVRPLQGRA